MNKKQLGYLLPAYEEHLATAEEVTDSDGQARYHVTFCFPNYYGVSVTTGYLQMPPTWEHIHEAAIIYWNSPGKYEVLNDHPLLPEGDTGPVADIDVLKLLDAVAKLEEKEDAENNHT